MKSTAPIRPAVRRSRVTTVLLAPVAAVLAVTGCVRETTHTFTEPLTLAGVEVSAERLNRGHDDYMTYCVACHGVDGKGDGHSAPGLVPPPRNFTQGQFKFTAVEQGELPPDEELLRVVRHGLNGTAMRPWDISDERLLDVIQYIKTFDLDDWGDKHAEPGAIIEVSEDPYGLANRDEAVKFGAKVYHGYARCFQCHPAYLTQDEIIAASKELLGMEVPVSLRENWNRSEAKDSGYDALAIPPDFTWHPIRTVNPAWPIEQQVQQYYRIIAAGITGAAMPAWKGMMDEKYIWAMAYYLQWLTELRDSPEREQFWARLGVKLGEDTPAVPAQQTS